MEVLVINLERNKDGMKYIDHKIKSFRLTHQRVKGVYGSSHDEKEIGEIYSKNKSLLLNVESISSGHIGYSAYHLKIMKKLIDDNTLNILILENYLNLDIRLLIDLKRKGIKKIARTMLMLAIQ